MSVKVVGPAVAVVAHGRTVGVRIVVLALFVVSAPESKVNSALRNVDVVTLNDHVAVRYVDHPLASSGNNPFFVGPVRIQPRG